MAYLHVYALFLDCYNVEKNAQDTPSTPHITIQVQCLQVSAALKHDCRGLHYKKGGPRGFTRSLTSHSAIVESTSHSLWSEHLRFYASPICRCFQREIQNEISKF